jgi:hypothetical protein
MAENTLRSTGRPREYKFDRGGMPVEMGPYIGIVTNNVDNTRSGRLQVWIEQFGATGIDGSPNLTDPTTWRTVRYITPFYGATKQSGSTGVGTYPGNRNSYGMWFTPPELGTQVLCFFVSGDPSVGGYYVGCIPEDGITHMIPAIGASSNFATSNAAQKQILNGVPLAPVTEINDINLKITDNPRFFDQTKPVQGVVEGILYQQGLNRDPIRGPIRSSSQRESPSNCYGISTPGKPIYQGGLNEKDIKSKLESGKVKLQDIAVVGRRGGHTFVMDDGDLEGTDTLVRIRTAKGHQITMSDDGDAFYITHANGQTWIELGKQGTVDVFSTNSINMRTQGVLNFHADKGINMYSGGPIRIKSNNNTFIEAASNLSLLGENNILIEGKSLVGIKSASRLALQGLTSTWSGGNTLNLKARVINLNGAATIPVPAVTPIKDYKLADTSFVEGQGWVVKQGVLNTIVNRAPTHEPYYGHGQGADVKIDLNPVTPTTIDPTSNTGALVAEVNAQPTTNVLTANPLVNEPTSTTSIGSLTTGHVTALTAQTALSQSLQYPAYNADGKLNPGFELNEENDPVYTGADLGLRGIGKYGQATAALVSAGFVKSSVIDLINSGAATVQQILSSPSAWTGALGMVSLLSYLSAPDIQNSTQVELMSGAYRGLQDAGILFGNEQPIVVATFLQPATEISVDDVVRWTEGATTPTETAAIEIIARQGQYAIAFYDAFADELGIIPNAVSSVDTVTRNLIDQEVADIIGDPKIPTPQYTDIQAEIANPITVTVSETADESTFRFAPGNKQG